MVNSITLANNRYTSITLSKSQLSINVVRAIWRLSLLNNRIFQCESKNDIKLSTARDYEIIV